MKRTGLMLAGLLALSCIGTAQAQLYKWVDSSGKITYSDLPPPKAARQLEKSMLEPSDTAAVALPYALADARKNHPVTLFTGAQCAPCTEARDFLKNRGIPFAEKSVISNEDIAKLRQISGDAQLPLLLVGRSQQLGFERGAWNLALTAASYPEDNKLPRDYQFAPAEPAAPKAPIKTEQPANANSRIPAAPPAAPALQRLPAAGNAPPGFRF
ncbi:MAG: glutaredoxin family protein [Glaciimonas sp.]|nr:glutaredoxin family protein [Glaciimonas sp.]